MLQVIAPQKMGCEHDLSLPITLTQTLIFHWIGEGGNPYCPVLFSRFNQTIGFMYNDSMKCPSSKPHTVVPWWPFCTGKQKAYAKCTALPTKYNTTHIKHLKCFPNFISVKGHTNGVTVTILMCKLQVPSDWLFRS